MATYLTVTNLTAGSMAVLGMASLAAGATRTREYTPWELDALRPGLRKGATAGMLLWAESPGLDAIRTYTAVVGAPTPDVPALGSADTVIVDTALDAVTMTLPPAANCPGRKMTFKVLSVANDLLIEGYAAETIDGVANMTVTGANAVATIVCNGIAWTSLLTDVSP